MDKKTFECKGSGVACSDCPILSSCPIPPYLRVLNERLLALSEREQALAAGGFLGAYAGVLMFLEERGLGSKGLSEIIVKKTFEDVMEKVKNG